MASGAIDVTLVDQTPSINPPARESSAAVPPPAPQRVRLMGMPISVVTESQAVRYIIDSLAAGRGGRVITPNLDQLRQYRKHAELRGMYEEAGLVVADGMPLVWASRLQRTPLPQRVAGSSMIFTLSQAAGEAGFSVFLLGGNPGSGEHAAEELRRRNPGLKIAGTCCPPVGFERNEEEMGRIRRQLAESQPDIVYVGLGFPKQERLTEQLRPLLPGAWFLGIGISFSFVAGEVRRAPRWMQRVGLEWMHRMVQEPGRLVKRYLIHGIPFGLRLMLSAIYARFAGKRN
jgi:N-acetylglucosaminyldiphosphoundecaprenol N-acetyl-beta-D-mannosaminyltransferase